MRGNQDAMVAIDNSGGRLGSATNDQIAIKLAPRGPVHVPEALGLLRAQLPALLAGGQNFV